MMDLVVKGELPQIKFDEGYSPIAYFCTRGFLTIRFGYNLTFKDCNEQ